MSFQSVTWPDYYLSVITASNSDKGSLRMGAAVPVAALDNATWLIVPGIVGASNSYSLQVWHAVILRQTNGGWSLPPTLHRCRA